jgi:putative PIN family toxin of toxin-antitoxin system
MTPAVVYDCMIFLQAVTNPHGTAGRCLAAVFAGAVRLIASRSVLDEAADVLTRPKTLRRFPGLTPEIAAAFLQRVEAVADLHDPPPVFTLRRDPKDSVYLNLAIAAGARLVVSRDNDLLDLMTGTDPDAVAFRGGWPDIAILDPVSFLATLAPPAAP